ncbi:hypothetical protein [Neisseria sicca]|uniref:hypothetical protein n=1 Tax=Neisseria sicca TaxID=490 RepID=UPI0011BCF963|nr:hypothetical protein [Neisseria sicca]
MKKKKVTEGEELERGVEKMVKVFMGMKGGVEGGEKMGGWEGKKGVVSGILGVEDMG